MSKAQRQRLATWLLTRCTSDYRRESLIGDLLEQYEQRGECWYWRQALHALRLHLARKLLDATERRVSVAEFIGDLALWIVLVLFSLMQFPVYVAVFFGDTPLIRSQVGLGVVSALTVLALMGAATLTHEIRSRTACAT